MLKPYSRYFWNIIILTVLPTSQLIQIDVDTFKKRQQIPRNNQNPTVEDNAYEPKVLTRSLYLKVRQNKVDYQS